MKSTLSVKDVVRQMAETTDTTCATLAAHMFKLERSFERENTPKDEQDYLTDKLQRIQKKVHEAMSEFTELKSKLER